MSAWVIPFQLLKCLSLIWIKVQNSTHDMSDSGVEDIKGTWTHQYTDRSVRWFSACFHYHSSNILYQAVMTLFYSSSPAKHLAALLAWISPSCVWEHAPTSVKEGVLWGGETLSQLLLHFYHCGKTTVRPHSVMLIRLCNEQLPPFIGMTFACIASMCSAIC